MKKLLSIAVAVFAVAAIADSYSPTIGVTEISTTNKNTLVAVSFTSLDNNSSTTISVKDLVCTNGLEVGTWIYVHTGSAYAAWKLESSGWTPAMSSTTGGQVIDASASDANQVVNYGKSFWVVLPAAPAVGTPKTFCIYGNATVVPTYPAISAGVNFVANPLQKDATLIVSSPTKGDEIVIPQDGTSLRYSYTVPKANAPAPYNVAGWRRNGEFVSTITIPAGQGFWYIGATGTVATLSFE